MENKTTINQLFPRCCLAGALSYAVHGSFFWAIMAMFGGWFYVFYWMFEYGRFGDFLRTFT